MPFAGIVFAIPLTILRKTDKNLKRVSTVEIRTKINILIG